MYTNEALHGIDEQISSTTIRPSFNLEVVLESVMALCPHKAALKAVTSKNSRTCTLILHLENLAFPKDKTHT